MVDSSPSPAIYLLSSGDYDQYTVHAVFTTRELAESARAAVLSLDSDYWEPNFFIEERTLYGREIGIVTRYWREVVIWDDGTLGQAYQSISRRPEFEDPHLNVPARWRWARAPVYGNRGGRLEVSGTDLDAVEALFAEKQAEILADPDRRNYRQTRGAERT